jgi:membrane-associated phospholipid phosphatase
VAKWIGFPLHRTELYAAVVWFAVVYMAEHWMIDVAVGVVMAEHWMIDVAVGVVMAEHWMIDVAVGVVMAVLAYALVEGVAAWATRTNRRPATQEAAATAMIGLSHKAGADR